MKPKTIALGWFLPVLLASSAPSQEGPPADREREAFVEALDFLTRGSGRWKGANRDHTPGDEKPESWGLEFAFTENQHGMRGRIVGIHDDGRIEELWTTLSVWDPARRIGVHYQVSAWGVYAEGQYVIVTPEEHEIFMRGYTLDHKRFTLRDTARVVGPDAMETNSLYLNATGTWEGGGGTRWSRVEDFPPAK